MSTASTMHAEAHPAGLGRRLLAILYDSFALLALWVAATALALVFTGGEAVPAEHPGFTAYLIAVAYGYLVSSWALAGQTLGMRAWRLEVVTLDGEPIDWRGASVRFLVAAASWACLGLGFWWALVHPRRRTWHDLVSGSVVLRRGVR